MTAVIVGAVLALGTAAAESRASAYGSPGQGLAGVGREASREEATSNLAEQGPTLVHRVAEVKHGIESNPPYAGHGTVGHLPALPALQAPPASPPADLWERIRAGFAMEDLEDSLVARWERFYAERPDYVARIVERSSRYLFYIVTEVERRGMPLEIALLPMIESAFNPTALSRAKASGIWQFIPSTGSQFGLRQDWWADSRRDVVAATQGALEYLSKLYAQFGDWHLSLAAYNWGEGSVARAIARAKAAGRDGSYLSLDMPAETRNYVPKLQAVKNIVRDPARYGLTLKPIPNEPYFKTVTLAQPIDIKRAIQLAQVSEEEFLALNPAYHRPVIGGRSEYQILLPAANADLFVANLEADAGPRVSWMAYRTQPGDRLEVLAKRFGTTVAALRAVNGMRNPAPVLPPGYNLLVPSDGPSDEALGSLQNAVFTQFPEYVPPRLHRVRRGETLASVAKRYGVAPATLARWNRLPPRASLRAGRTLYVSGPAPATQTHRFIMSGKRSALPVAEHATKASGKTARAAKQRGKASSLKGKKTAKSSLKSVPASKAKAKLRRR
ncbi:MAG: transglycosylase SLT domain-containing protein [Casimicrobiaceae bacterium]|nr:transglycosylase SLT domain-containing protein [Casimicrobiaceae bacterium]